MSFGIVPIPFWCCSCKFNQFPSSFPFLNPFPYLITPFFYPIPPPRIYQISSGRPREKPYKLKQKKWVILGLFSPISAGTHVNCKGWFGAGRVEWYRWTILVFYSLFSTVLCLCEFLKAWGPPKWGENTQIWVSHTGHWHRTTWTHCCVGTAAAHAGFYPIPPFMCPKMGLFFSCLGFFSFFKKKKNIDFCC